MAGGKGLKLVISICGKIDKSLGSAINNTQAQLDKIGSGAGKAAKAVTIATAAAGVKLVKDSVEAYTTYESALSKTAATAGVEKGSSAYNQLNEAAREAGRTTVKTAQESAEALGYMALAGWSVEDSTKGLMPVLKLSASTNTELATTSDLVTDSMANLGLGINDLNRYLDVSVAANNKSNQSATQLMEAYLGVGGVLNNLNSPIEESAAILGVLANRGTKGSEAGTALNAILVNMQKKGGDAYKAMSQLGISMYDQSGKARRLTDVFQDISDKTSGMTEQQRNLMYQMIGGKSHLDSFAKIMQGFTTQTADGTMEVYSLQRAFADSDGSLDKFYDTYTNTVEGSKAAMESAFDGMKLNLGEELAPTVSEFYRNLTDNMPEIEQVIMNFAERTIPVAGTALDFLAKHGDEVVSTVIALSKAFIGFKLATGTINGINSFITLFSTLKKISTTAGMVATIKGITGSLTGVSTTSGLLASSFMKVLGPAGLFVGTLVSIDTWLKTLPAKIEARKYAQEHFTESINSSVSSLGEQTSKLREVMNYADEYNKLKEKIRSGKLEHAELDEVRNKMSEIAEYFGMEYSTSLEVDSTQLDDAIDKARELEVLNTQNENLDLYNKLSDDAEKYTQNRNDLQGHYSRQATYQNNIDTLSPIVKTLERYQLAVKAANGNKEKINAAKAKYFPELDQAYEYAKLRGINVSNYRELLENKGIDDALTRAKTGLDSNIDNLKGVSTSIENCEKTVADYQTGLMSMLNTATATDDSKYINEVAQDVATLAEKAGISSVELAGLIQNSDLMANSVGKLQQAFKNGGFKGLQSELNTLVGLFETCGLSVQDFAPLIATALNQAGVVTKKNIDNINTILKPMGIEISFETNADDAAGGAQIVAKAIRDIPTHHDSYITITTTGISALDNIRNKIAKLPTFKEITIHAKQTAERVHVEARGTNHFPGGIAMVNDQKIADPREVIQEPSGRMYWYEGKNVIANVPRGAKIYPALESRSIINGSHRNGLERVPFDGYIAELHKNEQVLTEAEAEDYRSGGVFSQAIDGLRYTRSESGGNSGSGDNDENVTISYNPTIIIEGNGDEAAIDKALHEDYERFAEHMERWLRDRRRKSFSAA